MPILGNYCWQWLASGYFIRKSGSFKALLFLINTGGERASANTGHTFTGGAGAVAEAPFLPKLGLGQAALLLQR